MAEDSTTSYSGVETFHEPDTCTARLRLPGQGTLECKRDRHRGNRSHEAEIGRGPDKTPVRVIWSDD